MAFELNTIEARILGCLIEKEITTPDAYPLTLNSLTLACNQKSNRDPLMELDEKTVVRELDHLRDKNLANLANMAGSRVMKYEHQAARTLSLEKPALALLCELLVRGPQTAGELRGRASRMVPFESIGAVEEVMKSLIERQPEPLAVLLPRQAGRKEPRYEHLLCGEIKVDESTAAAAVPPPEKSRIVVQAEDERIKKLEAEVAVIRQELDTLKSQFCEFRKMLE
jgi:uncharacterized protein YceH (UPF0502 family)